MKKNKWDVWNYFPKTDLDKSNRLLATQAHLDLR